MVTQRSLRVVAVQRQSERLASGVVFVASSPRRLPSRCAFKTCAAVSCSSLATAATGLRCVCDVPRRPRRRHRTDGSSGDPGGRGLTDDPASSGGGGQREKRKWSQANARRGSCTSGGDSGEEDVSCSDDDEVRSLLASSSSSPVPLVFGSDPPRQARRLVAVNVPPAHAPITRAAPQVCSLSPRKRHCQGDDVIEGRGVQRPSLDFEKMQVRDGSAFALCQ